MLKSRIVSAICLVAALSSTSARADGDACQAILCLAGNWRDIAECVPPVQRILKRIALGRPVQCDLQDANGNTTSGNLALQTGTEPEASCAEAYGPNWHGASDSEVCADDGCAEQPRRLQSINNYCVNDRTGETAATLRRAEPYFARFYVGGVLQYQSWYSDSDIGQQP